MLTLYGLEISGNTYKAQLLMNILEIEYHLIPVDVKNSQHKSEDFLKMNPRGEFPVLHDASHIIWDSQAILIYLARQFGGKVWYPEQSLEMAHITQWLSVANGEIFQSLAKARSMLKFGYPGDLASYQQQGKSVLEMINNHLANRSWMATDQPSIADIACYPYIALCEEGRIPLQKYTAIHKWINRIQSLEGFMTMPGLPYIGNTNPG